MWTCISLRLSGLLLAVPRLTLLVEDDDVMPLCRSLIIFLFSSPPTSRPDQRLLPARHQDADWAEGWL